jgi:hypothetical protein
VSDAEERLTVGQFRVDAILGRLPLVVSAILPQRRAAGG